MTPHLNRRQCARTLLAAALPLALPAHSRQSGAGSAADSTAWPGKPVRIITPFPVGGGPDGTARLLAGHLARTWQQPVVVENRPGGNGFIAIEAFKRGARDGTDIIQLDNVHLSAYPHLFKKLPYDPQQDFAVVLPLFRAFFFVCVATHSPYRSMADLIADARTRPGALNYGSWSVGNPVHLASALLAALTGTHMEHVVYRETGQLYASVANGELAFALGSSATAGPLVRAGRLRFLAVLATQRLAGFADVPTVAESGGPPDAVVTGINSFAVARDAPAAVVEKIRRDTSAALHSPQVRAKFATFGYENHFPAPQEFADALAEESWVLGALIRRIGVHL